MRQNMYGFLSALLIAAALLSSAHCEADSVKLAKVRVIALKLKADVWKFWLTNGPDSNGLGVYGTLDRTGNPIEPFDKGLIQQSRHLWAFTMCYNLHERSPRVKKAAGALYTLISTKFRDPKDGRFFYKVARDGSVIDSGKSLASNMYTVAGLARYGRTFKVPAASNMALTCFKKWDSLTLDPKNKGWNGASSTGKTEPPKSQDSAVHILEALVELWQTFPTNAFVRSRLRQAVDVLVNKVMPSGGQRSRRAFSASWVPDSSNTDVEFGHELVSTWMLLNLRPKLAAAKIITRAQSSALLSRAIKTGGYTAVKGYDAANGGFWTVGKGAASTPDKTQKVWWQQAEGMLAMYQMYKSTKKVQYLDKLLKTANWVWNNQRDSIYGEWYWGVDPGSKQASQAWPGTSKGLEWKASYHSGRASLFLSSWLSSQSAM